MCYWLVDNSSIKLKKSIDSFLDIVCKCKKYRLNERNVKNADIYLGVHITNGFVSLFLSLFFWYLTISIRRRFCTVSRDDSPDVSGQTPLLPSHTRCIWYTRRKALGYFLYDGRVHALSGVSFALFCPGGGRKAASAAQCTLEAVHACSCSYNVVPAHIFAQVRVKSISARAGRPASTRWIVPSINGTKLSVMFGYNLIIRTYNNNVTSITLS